MRQQKLRKQINLTITLQVLCCCIVHYRVNKDQESAVNKHLNSCYDTNYLDSKTNNELESITLQRSIAHQKTQIHIK